MDGKNERKEIEEFSGLLFVSLMFIGAGIGLLLGRPDVGGAIGMGVGFLLMGIVRIKVKEVKPLEVTVSKYFGVTILVLIGVSFILAGILLYTRIEMVREILLPYLGGTIIVVIGLFFILKAITLFKFK
ncbi:MAG: hypothetical protein QW534_09150 [Candidatus Methanomethylicia archaeon]